MNNESLDPQLGGDRAKSLLSGQEPLLKASPNYRGMGNRQKAVLQWLARQEDGEVTYVQLWVWVMRFAYPDYPHISASRQNRLRPFISKTTWSLLQSLVRRSLVLLVRQPGEKFIDVIRLRVPPKAIWEQVGEEDLIKTCPVCKLPLGLDATHYFYGCCSKKCEMRWEPEQEND